MDKKAMRQALIEQRLSLSDRPRRVAALQHVVRRWLAARGHAVVGAYWPIKGEFDPLPALCRWVEDGQRLAPPQPRRIALPVPGGPGKILTFHAWHPGCPMEPGAYGIPVPKGGEVVVPTLLFVPCVGYAAGGYRLGYGGGFYDRTLTTLRPRPVAVGLGFANGFVPEFEPEPHDVPLDAILSDDGEVWPP